MEICGELVAERECPEADDRLETDGGSEAFCRGRYPKFECSVAGQ